MDSYSKTRILPLALLAPLPQQYHPSHNLLPLKIRLYAQNSLRQQSTGLTPFQCVLGFQPPLFPWDGEPSDVPAVDYWFRESERVWDEADHHLRRAMGRRKLTADLRRSDSPP